MKNVKNASFAILSTEKVNGIDEIGKRTNVQRNASTIVVHSEREQASRHDTFVSDFDWVWHSTAIEILGVALSLFHTLTHTRVIHCMMDSIEWMLLLTYYHYYYATIDQFYIFPFLAFVCRPSMLFAWCHPYYFVWRVRTLYIETRYSLSQARDSGDDGGGGHALRSRTCWTCIRLTAMRISRKPVAAAAVVVVVLKIQMNGTGHHAVTLEFLLELFAQLESNTISLLAWIHAERPKLIRSSPE